jgi:Ca2+-binding RTX toxin-like protein
MLLVAAMAAALVATSGVAWAAVVQCPPTEFETCLGTEGPDAIIGTDDYNNIHAQGGDDVAYGGGGYADDIYGMAGNDTLSGGPGVDYLSGSSGNDTLYGDAGEDYIDAREHGGTGIDMVSGGGGNDEIDANDGQVDFVSCGAGADTVRFEAGIDFVSPDCENRNPVQRGS